MNDAINDLKSVANRFADAIDDVMEALRRTSCSDENKRMIPALEIIASYYTTGVLKPLGIERGEYLPRVPGGFDLVPIRERNGMILSMMEGLKTQLNGVFISVAPLYADFPDHYPDSPRICDVERHLPVVMNYLRVLVDYREKNALDDGESS